MAGEPLHMPRIPARYRRRSRGGTGRRGHIPSGEHAVFRPASGHGGPAAWPLLVVAFLFAGACVVPSALAGEESKTVIGPSNQALYDGARALLEGDGEAGVRLTLEGLARVTSKRDRITAWANLCAGYVLLEQLDTALEYCDRVIEANDRHWRSYSNRALILVRLGRYAEAERDLRHAEAIAPKATTVKRVRAMLLDAVEPVTPRIEIDDRRQGGGQAPGDGVGG